MDIQMPVKDGYQATQEILNLDKDCNIIALTSYTGDDVKKKCLDLKMKEVFNKPLQSKQLLSSVHKYFFED